MKKILFSSLIVFLVASWSLAATFNPTPLVLTVQAGVQYDFDGSELIIPFTIGGTPASVWLVINTNGKADTISQVRNGYLGWHYVDKIDTTVYVSQRYDRAVGQTSIVWDGKNENGNLLAEDTYSYYIWGYDNVTARQEVSWYVQIAHGWDAQYCTIYENDDQGLPLARPVIMGSESAWSVLSGIAYGPTWFTVAYGTAFKWVLGGDSRDYNNYVHTVCPGFENSWDNDIGFNMGGAVFDPNDYSTFYAHSCNIKAKTGTMEKWQFVSDGQATKDEDWLGWENLTWEEQGMMIGAWSQKDPSFTDGNYIYVYVPGLHQKEIEWNWLRCVSFDGDVIFEKLMHDWYYPDDPNPHGYINGSFHNYACRFPYQMILSSHTCCLTQLIDTSRLVADVDDDATMLKWENANGDYWLDSAYDPNVEPAWYCLADDKTTSMRRASASIDRNGFTIIGTGYYGVTSLAVATQDGTGVGNMACSDDTISDNVYEKFGGQVCDNGSMYDGYYLDNRTNTEAEAAAGGKSAPVSVNKPAKISDANRTWTWYVACDSAGGIISKSGIAPAVEDDVQAAFAVAQNAPNPFNPTTTINFTIPTAAQVTVDIYNVAGQKVDTLVNDVMNAGGHSVVWNANGFSNGVYFYTVKSGDFSKTMKMTLVK